MGLEVAVDWIDLGWIVNGLVNLACLAWLLRATPPSTLRTAVGLMLALNGGAATFFLWWTTGGQTYFPGEAFDNAMLFGPLAVLVAWLATERGRSVPRWFWWATAAGILLLTVAFIAVPAWRIGIGGAGSDRVLTQSGPLFPATEAVEIGLNTVLAVLFLRAGIRRDNPILALAGAGFAYWTMLGGISTLPYLVADEVVIPAGVDPTWFLVSALAPVATCLYILGATAYIVARSERNRTRRLVIRWVFGVAAAGMALSVAVFFAERGEVTGGTEYGTWSGLYRVLTGLTALFIPVFSVLYLVAEANVAREAKVWNAVRRGSVPALMLATFFVVSEGAQSFFSGAWGPVVGLLATLPIVLLLAPIQRLGERVGQSIAPEAGRQDAAEKESLFERQVRYAWVDGRIGATERERLVDLRRALGIAAERAEDIERRVVAGVVKPMP